MKVFISYRRGDARDFAGRLADRLREEAQIDQIFLDVDGIEPGEDFKSKIDKAIRQSAACLVLIGKEWTGKSASNAPARIYDQNDFVRLEVREALNSPVKVIPVLVNGATMPEAEELPEDLARLSNLNAVSVRHDSFRRDADYLADAILARKEPSPLSRYWNRHPFQEGLVRATLGLAAAAFVLVVGAGIYQSATGLALNQALGGIGPMLLLVVATLLTGMIFPLLVRRRRRRRTAS
jgi:hypothetical protein